MLTRNVILYKVPKIHILEIKYEVICSSNLIYLLLFLYSMCHCFNIGSVFFYTDQRRNYKNVIHAFTTIAKNEGITTLWRGSVATMGRAVVVNVSQLATYSHIKFLIATNSMLPLKFCLLSTFHSFTSFLF